MVFHELINVHFPGSHNFSESIKTLNYILQILRGHAVHQVVQSRGLAVSSERGETSKQRMKTVTLMKDENKKQTPKHSTSLAVVVPRTTWLGPGDRTWAGHQCRWHGGGDG